MTQDGPTGQQATTPARQHTRLVWNPFTSEYVVFAPARMHRREGSAECAFCDDLSTGRVAPGTLAWVRPNDFPALRPPVGECLILIYSPHHEQTFADLTTADVVRVIGLWQQVYCDLSRRYPCVMTWETSGEAIGQTQWHPHGQTYGVSTLPDTLAREISAIESSSIRGKGCPYCAVVRQERGGPRVVVEGEHWLGIIPEFARYPYQVLLLPQSHYNAVTGCEGDGASVVELAESLLRIVRAYHAVFEGQMPYMLALHQFADERFHFHIELLPTGRAPGKLKIPASSESAWGFWVNDALPEVKAAELRAAIAREPHS